IPSWRPSLQKPESEYRPFVANSDCHGQHRIARMCSDIDAEVAFIQELTIVVHLGGANGFSAFFWVQLLGVMDGVWEPIEIESFDSASIAFWFTTESKDFKKLLNFIKRPACVCRSTAVEVPP